MSEQCGDRGKNARKHAWRANHTGANVLAKSISTRHSDTAAATIGRRALVLYEAVTANVNTSRDRALAGRLASSPCYSPRCFPKCLLEWL